MVKTASKGRQEKQPVPEFLVKEWLNGKPIYYKGYRDVLNKTKKLEDIMGCSSLQCFVIDYLLRILYEIVDEENYFIATNEAGIHLDHRNNFSNDIAIYDLQVLTPEKISRKYSDAPPVLSIEVGINEEVDRKETGFTISDYVALKVQKLLDFGVEKVLWILIDSQKVLVAKQGEDWLIKNWEQEIELFQGQAFNVGEYLKKRGIKLTD
ncbi:MAG: Uma2 family endonuclease [Saprospiraceae bacterium]|nr:MAG: Uma2 family endonuclease [Saprospiraceae bacterium]